MLDDKLEQTLEAPLQAIREQPGDHFNAILRCRQLGLHSRPRRRLQNVCIQTLRCARDAGALRFHFIKVRHDAEGRLAHEWRRERDNGSSVARSNNCTSFVIKNIIHIHLPLNHNGAGMDGLGQAVQRVAHNRGFNQLQVHCLVCNRLPEDRVRGGVRRQDGERRRLHNFLMEDVAAVADSADAVKFSNAVAILVHADVRLDIEHFVRRLV